MKRYTTLDTTTLGPALDLREGGLVVTCTTDGSNALRNARSVLGVSGSRWYWECVPYGDEAMDDLVVLGVVLAATASNTSPGVATGTHGYVPGTGDILSGGSTVDTIAIASPRDVIGFALDLVSGTPTLALYVNRLLVYTWTLAASETWHPAVSVGCVTALDLSVFVNFGRRAFENPVPDGYKAGLYTNPQVGSVIRVSSDDVLLDDTGTPPHARFVGDVKNAASFYLERGVSFWPDGRSGSSYSLGDLTLDNQWGVYDNLITDPPRDAPIELALIELDDQGLPVGAPIPLPPAILDTVSESREDEITIKLRDPLTALQRPVQRKVFLPFAAEGAANRPYPIALGACRNVAPVLTDDVNRVYVIHDAPLTQVDTVRDKGDPLDPGAVPPDWTLSSDQRGIALQTEPVGKLTADVSSQGNAEVTPPPSSDALDGYGDMATDVGGMPENWVVRDTSAHIAVSWVSPGRMECRASGIPSSQSESWIVQYLDQSTDRNFVPIRKGVQYRLTFAIPAVRWPTIAGSLTYGRLAVAKPSLIGVDTTLQTAWSTSGVFAVGSTTAYFRADHDGTLEFSSGMVYDTTWSAAPGWVALPWWVTLDDVLCEALTPVPFDCLEGYGQMLSGLDRWADDGSGGSSSWDQSDLTTSGYTMGRLYLEAATGETARVIYGSSFTAAGSPLFVAGQHYRIAWRSQGTDTDARLSVVLKKTSDSSDVVLGTFSGSGVNEELTFVCADDGELVLEGATVGSTARYYVSYLRVLDTTAQDAAEGGDDTPLEGITLEQYFAEILETRGGESASIWSQADAAAIDTATPYAFGVAMSEQASIIDALRAPLDGYAAAITSDNEGVLRIVQLTDPDDGTPVFEIDQTNCATMPTRSTDTAPGLTTNAGARRNWSVYGPSDFVDDYDPNTGIDAATRARFMRKSQYLVASAATLHDAYASAQDEGPLELLFDVPDHAQAQLDAACDLYSVARANWQIGPVNYEGAPPDLWPGKIVRVTWTRGRWDTGPLTTGKNLLTKRVRLYPLAQKLEIGAFG